MELVCYRILFHVLVVDRQSDPSVLTFDGVMESYYSNLMVLPLACYRFLVYLVFKLEIPIIYFMYAYYRILAYNFV